MKCRFNRSLSWLALATVSGALWANGPLQALPKATLSSLKAVEDCRAAVIASHVDGMKAAYGLKGSDEFREVRRQTDEFGKTHVRFRQFHQGVLVWGSGLMGHMNAVGGLEETQAKTYANINLQAANLLSEDEIRSRCLKRLGLSTTTVPVKVEKVVFPTRLQDGLKLKRNEKGELAFDETFSVATPRKSQAYVWAYHATVLEGQFGENGATELIVDAATGQVLKKWDSRVYDTPAIGHSQYNGTVTLNTNTYDWVNQVWKTPNLMPPTGSYNALRDTTRTTKINPAFGDLYPEKNLPGIATYWSDNYYAGGLMSGYPPYLVTGNEWGDGQPFHGNYDRDQYVNIATANLSVNGQTVAVDATYGVTSTWDFYKNVFGRNGMDDQGTPPFVFVHVNEGFYQTMTPMLNAYFAPYNQSMYFGDGDLSQGYGPFASLDITAHEMSHGVVEASGGLNSGYESGGLNEATADIFAAMTRFWMWGPGKGTGSVIPDTAPNAPIEDGVWTTGRQITVDNSAIRNMVKPSLDGYSYDQWFDGMWMDDVHFTMGPGTRAFYFLSQGASNSSSALNYSPCLPGGMAGLGNDKAARIWYRAISTKLADPDMDFHGFRAIMLDAATELHGAGSAEVAAVQNAFAAVNVGAAAGGVEPVMVGLSRQIEGIADEGTDDVGNWGYNWDSVMGRFILVPVTGTVQILPTPTITNTPNQGYTWALGGLSAAVAPQGGKIVDGKAFAAPNLNHTFWTLKVSSDQDPSRFAATIAYACNMDTDADTEFDALDLAAYALSWGRSQEYFPSDLVPLLDISNNGMTDDNDIALAKLGFNSLFAH